MMLLCIISLTLYLEKLGQGQIVLFLKLATPWSVILKEKDLWLTTRRDGAIVHYDLKKLGQGQTDQSQGQILHQPFISKGPII